MTLTRRAFLKQAGVLAAGTALAGGIFGLPIPFGSARAQSPGAVDDGTVFSHGIASGDPTPSGVILWTRLTPAAWQTGEDVVFELSKDAAFETVVMRGTIPNRRTGPERDYTIKVDTDGHLAPDTEYHYRFVMDETSSTIGRCKTLPEKDADIDKVSFAAFSCSRYPAGYFSGYGYALQDDVDFVLHVGDYIYENNVANSAYGRPSVLPSGAPYMETQEDFYAVYQTYRSDPNLQALHAGKTWMHISDDHEIVDNRYYDYENDRPTSESKPRADKDEIAIFHRGAKAYAEWMPTRSAWNPDAEHILDRWTPYQDFRFGKLLQLWMVDGRWYRDEMFAINGTNNADLTDEDAGKHTMLGKEQLAWLLGGIAKNDTRWRFLANGTLFVPLGGMVGIDNFYLNMDAWDGYRRERDAVAHALRANRPYNNVFIAGDMHCTSAQYVQTEYGWHTEVVDKRIGVEFMVGGLTSDGLGGIVESGGGTLPPGHDEVVEQAIITGNPHFRMFNWQRHGYAVLRFSKRGMDSELYFVDRSKDTLDGSNRVLARAYHTPDGEVALQETARNHPDGRPTTPAVPPTQAQYQAARQRPANAVELRALGDAERHALA